MIENRQFRFAKNDLDFRHHPGEAVEERLGSHALRWYISGVEGDEIVVEATLFDGELRRFEDAGEHFYPGRTVAVSIIPTGVGCEVGGYAGDAAPAMGLLGRAVDYLITNPNAVNASNFIDLPENVLYTEGYCIDQFCKGRVDLFVPHANRVGLIIEATSAANLDVVYNVVNTARAVHGVDIVDCVVTERPIGSRCVLNDSGAYVGTVERPEEIVAASRKLLDAGAQAIAVTTNIQDLPHDEYVRHFEGEFPNPMGGVEAIISHLVVQEFGLPAAHAPMINLKELALVDAVVDARGGGEMASASGLACVLLGLARAPQLGRAHRVVVKDVVNYHNLLAVVAPASCLGGLPVVHAAKNGVPIIAVEENATVLDVTAEKLGLAGVHRAANYVEAAGLLLALRHGITPAALRRPLATLRPERTAADTAATEPAEKAHDNEERYAVATV